MRSPLVRAVLFAAVLASPALLATSVASADNVDTYLEAEMAKRKIPGLALAVVKQGAVIKMKGYGIASVELDAPVTPDSVFELASITKQFTASAIMTLIEDGKLTVDDPISRYLPDTPPAWKDIRVRHLLTHTAGLPSMFENFHSLYVGEPWRSYYSTQVMYDSARKDAIGFAPGERWEYSDSGFFLLGMIVERASGKRYAQFLAERFFRPLGMRGTSVLDQSAIIKHRAPGYALRNGRLTRIQRDIQLELPSHYGVLSSVRDLATWEQALTSGRALKPESLATMWTPVTLADGGTFPYGFGWGIDHVRDHRVIAHTGLTGTEYVRLPDDGVAVIVLTNLGHIFGRPEGTPWGLARGVAARYVPGVAIRDLPVQPDADGVTTRVKDAMAALADGGDAPLVLQRYRTLLSKSTRDLYQARLNTARAFTFIACDDLRGRTVERNGAVIARRCHFRMETGAYADIFYTAWLTPAGQLADIRSVTE